MNERQKEEEYMQHKEQEENMIRQCKGKEGNIITWRVRNLSSQRMVEGNKNDVWIRRTMQKHVENLCEKNKSNGGMDE
jgi:hypothetical protein